MEKERRSTMLTLIEGLMNEANYNKIDIAHNLKRWDEMFDEMISEELQSLQEERDRLRDAANRFLEIVNEGDSPFTEHELLSVAEAFKQALQSEEKLDWITTKNKKSSREVSVRKEKT